MDPAAIPMPHADRPDIHDPQSAVGEAPGESECPLIWAVMGYRAGENSQILALAESLGWPFRVVRIAHHSWGVLASLLRTVGLGGVDRANSSLLQEPWPDLVISAGFRNEPLCRWIRQQSNGKTRLVHIGRPWASLDHFDLVITTPQYRLPNRSNILHNQTTLHRASEQALTKAREEWLAKLAPLPRPYITVIIGGNSGPYTFGLKAAGRLAQHVNDMARRLGGSLLITTSSRTSARAADKLEQMLTVPANFFRWVPNAESNPYFAFLALADKIVVTGDSIAMLSEACATRKPVYIFDLGTGAYAMHRAPPSADADLSPKEGDDFRFTAYLYRQLMRFGPRRLSRDLRLVHNWLIAEGRAVWVGQPFPDSPIAPLQDMERAVTRVKKLLRWENQGAKFSTQVRTSSTEAKQPPARQSKQA